MSGRPSANMLAAMRLVLRGVAAYTAAKRCNLAPASIYRSRLYKQWQQGVDIRPELAFEAPRDQSKGRFKKRDKAQKPQRIS